DAAAVWRKIASIHADKCSMYETNLLTHLQISQYIDDQSMQEHLMKMTVIKERLAEMNCWISGKLSVAYIQTSLSLVPSF
ncbi:hypothetical protein BYT27DRAFT_7030496, partial [Phlegmacium glaucopus]